MSLLRKNEKEANFLVAKVMRFTFLIFTLIYLLNVIGIFTVDKLVMTIAYIDGGCLLLLPTFLINIRKMDDARVKYINVICASLFVTILATTLTFHVVAIYVYPIAIAGLYFTKKLNIVATSLTVAGASLGQILEFALNTLPDANFTDWKHVIVFGVVPRALLLIAVAAIFTMLCSRTASMLSNMIKTLERMEAMKENAVLTSEAMYGMMTELSGITDDSLQANQEIANESERLLEGATENTQAVRNVGYKIHDITEQLKGLSHMNRRTSKLTEQIGINTQHNSDAAGHVSTATQQNSAGTECLAEIVQQIKELSEQLNKVVKTN